MNSPGRAPRRGGVLGIGFGVALLLVLAVVGAGEVLSRPALHGIGPAPPDLPAEPVRLPRADGAPVHGWLLRGELGAGAVLLLHGVRSDRRSMIERARFLYRLGYSVLLVDLPAHGESVAERITFGAREASGVEAALRYLAATLPGERIGVIGVSLGAASLVLCTHCQAPAAAVLESMFPTIDEAVADRLRERAGAWAVPLAPLLLWQLPWRTGVAAQALRPIDALPRLRVPLLIATGSADRRTTLAETQRLLAAAAPPKQLWVVDGAAHVDLHAFDRAGYEAAVAAFFARYLRGERL